MQFEVLNRDGNVVMHTTSVSCIPTVAELTAMGCVGYRYKLDGKVVSKSKICDYVQSERNSDNTSTPYQVRNLF